MIHETLVQTLSRLEADLHRPELRGDAVRLNALLHPDFEEVGRSGRHWSRADILAMMLSETVPVEVVADGYAAVVLQPGAALLTYRAAHRLADGSLARHTLRASVWLQTQGRWQMRYHQGTAAANPW
ncbi:nuclear transport factor 2 family protein [Roseateles amylovorans]|uniref:Nuclear transport factor 2 family protein n=1 Tax=Roseateles amylovorans TaxID=2978473 RepID=A0ABY6ATH6_9BURK|nr:nuclear transport factor 2 family protein [Roseateles amylovorans]UXH76531.1 nuclear transport factor 2 family protein [Roseateles amylovorans]